MSKIRRILCPVDFSEPSDAALRYADDLAQGLGAELLLVHVYQLPFYPFQEGEGYGEDLKRQVAEDIEKAIGERVATVQSPAKVKNVEGIPHAEITRLASEEDVDLVVMGTHGRTGLDHFLIGSVAERVVRTSSVPVLTVPQNVVEIG